MKILFAAITAGTIFFLTGCGHSGMMYLNGTSVQLGYNPETNQVGIGYLDGESIAVGSKENTLVELELCGDSTVGGNTAAMTSNKIKKIRYSTGIQINGYMVELAEACPDFAATVLRMMKEAGRTEKYYIIENGRLKEIAEEEYKSTKGAFKVNGGNLSVDQNAETAENSPKCK